jgi:hypothetical protein
MSLPGSSSTRLITKVLLFKAAPGSDLFKFNHDLSAVLDVQGIAPEKVRLKYVGTGPDPADLDLTSEEVFSQYNNKPFARLPHDCWIPRQMGLDANLYTGQVLKRAELPQSATDYYALEDVDATLNSLNWKNLRDGDSYKQRLSDFANIRKSYLLHVLETQDISEQEKSLARHDLSDFVINYKHSTNINDFTNGVDLELASDPRALYSQGETLVPISSASFSESFLSTGQPVVPGSLKADSIPLIEENDVVEIRVKYVSDAPAPIRICESGLIDADGYQRVFMGFVSTVSRSFQYGGQEQLSITCNGISKLLSLYDTQFVPSLGYSANVNIEEGIEASDLRMSVWQNKFNGMSASDIFRVFMNNALLSFNDADLASRQQELDQKIAEKSREYAELLASTNLDSASALPSATPSWNPPLLPVPGAYNITSEIQRQSVEAQLESLRTELDYLHTAVDTRKPLQALIEASTKDLPGTLTPGSTLDMSLYTPDISFFRNIFSFQLIHAIPIVLAAAKRLAAREAQDATDSANPVSNLGALSQVVGVTEQGMNIAYRTLVANAFRMFYTELKRPSQVFSEVRNSTYLEIFEDRPGVLRMRPPKYNIMNLNTSVADFPDGSYPAPEFTIQVPGRDKPVVLNSKYILSPNDILGITLSRDDASIVTRSDHAWQVPLNGNEYVPGYTGYFTEAGMLTKYGLRTTGMLQNPLAITKVSAAYMSALAVAVANRTARSAKVTVFNNREYQLGQLYYIPLSSDNTGESYVVSRGLVGYVTSIDTAFSYNSAPAHSLTLEYVRQAEILELTVPAATPSAVTETLAESLSQAANPVMLPEALIRPQCRFLPEPSVDTPTASPRKVYYANFRKLPEALTLARKLSTDLHNDLEQGTSNPNTATGEKVQSGTGTTCFDRLVLPNGAGTSELISKFRKNTYAETLGGLGIPAVAGILDNATKVSRIQYEQDLFCTPYLAAPFTDPSSLGINISKGFLAKLVLSEYDPRLQLYPQRIDAVAAVRKCPSTETFKYRQTDDLLRVVAAIVSAYADPASRSTFKLDSLPNYPIISDLGYRAVRFNAPDGTYSVDVAHPTSVDSPYIYCALTRGKGAPSALGNRLLVFHVPYVKSLRLCNLINEGTIANGGYRQSSGTSRGDVHSKGSAVLFSDINVALWSIDEIFEACTEFLYLPDPGATGEHNSVIAEYLHLSEANYNATREPRFRDPNVPTGFHSPIYTGVPYESDSSETGIPKAKGILEDAANFMQQFGYAPQAFAVSKIGHMEETSTSFSIKSYALGLKSKRYTLVPVSKDYFTSYFGALAHAMERAPHWKETAIVQSATPVSSDSKNSLVVVVMDSLTPVSNSGTYKISNPIPECDNRSAETIALTPAESAALVDVSITINNPESYPLLSRNYPTLAGFLTPRSGVEPRPHFVILADARHFQAIGASASAVMGYSQIMSHSPLAALWHLSYASPEDNSFQTDVSEFGSARTLGKINLIPLQRKAVKAGEAEVA